MRHMEVVALGQFGWQKYVVDQIIKFGVTHDCDLKKVGESRSNVLWQENVPSKGNSRSTLENNVAWQK